MFPSTTYGTFASDGQSYRIDSPCPPVLLTNPLYNDEGYLTLANHYGSGDATLTGSELTQSISGEGRKTLYCRDENTGDVWCPGVFPMMSVVTNYRCEHHDTYSVVSSERNGIAVSWTIWVPFSGTREIWIVRILNYRSKRVMLSLVPAVQLLCTGFSAPRFFDNQEQVGTCTFFSEINGMVFFAGNPYASWKRKHVVLAGSSPVVDYCGDIQTFLGAPQAMAFPHALFKGGRLGQTPGCIGLPFISLRCEIGLDSGQSSRCNFLLAPVESTEEARKLAFQIREPDLVDEEKADTERRRREQRDRLVVRTPDPQIDAFVNLWVRKGLEYCLLRKNAPRDNLQFANGLVMSRPDLARREILRVLRYQYNEGWIVRSWFPMDRTRYGDCHLWIIHTTCGYLKFSDDMDFLHESVPFIDGGEGTVLEHMERAVLCSLQDTGPHGLPRIRYADWNDAMNLKDPDAESVFCAMFLGYALEEMRELMLYLGRADESDRYQALHAALRKTVNEVAWDETGGHYVAAFSGGEIIGGSKSEGSTLYAYPQSWAILGRMVPGERLPRVLKALDKRMDTEFGTAVNLPAYDHWEEKLGRISAQIPGTTENGAVYCHVTGFKAAADCLLGRGDIALRSLKKIMPDSEANPVEHSFGTPYALTSSYILNPAAYGRAGRPWLTGTQDWFMRTVVEGLLGLRRAYGGFRIAPAFPNEWKQAEIRIRRADDTYHVRIKAVDECEGMSVTLDDQPVPDDFIPFQSGGHHEIQVLVGSRARQEGGLF